MALLRSCRDSAEAFAAVAASRSVWPGNGLAAGTAGAAGLWAGSARVSPGFFSPTFGASAAIAIADVASDMRSRGARRKARLTNEETDIMAVETPRQVGVPRRLLPARCIK